ncbi:MAG: hypothetical protein NC127_08595 [Muribaculum sp.]|nr:hypothetical protein [Muribaculum sp.]
MMDLTAIDRLEIMRKRQAYFSALAEEFTSFADFIKAHDLWLAIMGIQLTEYDDRLELYMQLDFAEYEQYYVIQTPDGNLTVSDIILWQDECCCNSWLNVTTRESANEEDILSSY